MRATDEDAGSFGNLTFSFSDEDRGKPFVIITEPGGGFANIRTSRVLDYEEDSNYTLTIIVEDVAENEDERRSVYVL